MPPSIGRPGMKGKPGGAAIGARTCCGGGKGGGGGKPVVVDTPTDPRMPFGLATTPNGALVLDGLVPEAAASDPEQPASCPSPDCACPVSPEPGVFALASCDDSCPNFGAGRKAGRGGLKPAGAPFASNLSCSWLLGLDSSPEAAADAVGDVESAPSIS